MDLLAQDIKTITFQDVVDFCDDQVAENTELDYKQIIPRDIKKHFAAMSNRFGGLIIVGVEEDSQTGLPSKCEGLVNDGKLIDQIHQHANNVRPLPSYDVCTTNEVSHWPRRYRTVLYWRPLVPGLNDTDEHLVRAAVVSRSCDATPATCRRSGSMI